MSRILILSSGSPCRNPRPLKEAETLGLAGHDVTLLTVSESPELDRMEQALVAGRPFSHESVGRNPGGLRRFMRRARQRIARQLTATGLPTLHALGQVGPLRERALALPADLTIVHNEIPFWIGCDLLRRGRRVAADFEDWHSEDLLPADRRGRPLVSLRRLERELLLKAAYTSTTSAALSAALAQRYSAPAPHVLTNSFPLQSDPHAGPPGTPPAFFWFSQTIGPGRGLEIFCDAWVRTTQPSRLVLLGQPGRGFDRELLARLPAAFAARVTLQPLVPPPELPALIARHDVGLALEQSWIPNRDLTITNKILQYLNAGLAVVATPTTGQREVLARAPDAGRLVDFNAPAAAAATLDELICDPKRLARTQHQARALASSTYCWEREAPRLVALVATALTRPLP
jgi:glycosyltransferase involved in cell wall biosynthesis